MNRRYIPYLSQWLQSPNRLPLIMRGARQVGKTWLARNLAETSGYTFVELNLEKRPDYRQLFTSNNPQEIIRNIEAALSMRINPQKSILFIDEVQAAPQIIGMLRWFAEEMPQLAVIAAGSLLEFVLDRPTFSVPVGRIEYLYIEPLSFEEYLGAHNKEVLVDYLNNYHLGQELAPPIHEQFLKYFRDYIIVGGMPRAVSVWAASHSLDEVSKIHQNLFTTYEEDFNRYRDKILASQLEDVLKAIPKTLGEKFVYTKVNRETNPNITKQALELLSKALICHKIRATAANGIPLAAEVNEKFNKLILLDVGLCSAALNLTLHRLPSPSDFELINSGGIAEQVTGQLLRTTFPFYQEPELFYWIRHNGSSSAEIDYVIQHGPKMVPLEVKAGSSGSLKSLHIFMELKKLNHAVRIYSGMPSITDVTVIGMHQQKVSYKLLSLPFYLAGQIPRILDETS